ncbi:MAG TPA: glycosyltransferase, partial [Miltoncostaeaceae bacterium]|nr:glycosyltransferase [Miltoncostaeaceae bacterium]
MAHPSEPSDIRLGVYLDARYRIEADGTPAADIPAVRLITEVGRHFDALTVFGRAGAGGAGRYALPAEAALVRLPDYPAVRPGALLHAGIGTARAMWRGLDHVDGVWVFGPHPFGALMVALALVRCRAVALGVRQDSRQYFRLRASGPGRAPLLAVLGALDEVFRALARHLPTVVVGDDLAARYGDRRRPAIVTTFCQLRSDQLVVDPPKGEPGPPMRLLTVGRIEPEKNPVLLVRAMAEMERRRPGRFHLTWIGSGSREAEVREAVSAAGLEGTVDLA